MDALALLLSKFSEEVLAFQGALLFGIAALTLYWLLVRVFGRKKRDWVPAGLVKDYLDRVDHEERDIRLKLFGEQTAPSRSVAATSAPISGSGQQVVVKDPALVKELEALRAQLGSADKRSLDSDKTVTALKAEIADLQEKLKNTSSAAPASGGAPGKETAAMQTELEELRAKLSEYEVIEDDLANLKKFQVENKALKERLEAFEKGGAAPAAPAPIAEAVAPPQAAAAPAPTLAPAPVPAPEPAPTPEPAPAAPENQAAKLAVVSGGASAPVAASAADSPAAAPVVAPVAASEKTVKQKEDELLSEFEKMLAS